MTSVTSKRRLSPRPSKHLILGRGRRGLLHIQTATQKISSDELPEKAILIAIGPHLAATARLTRMLGLVRPSLKASITMSRSYENSGSAGRNPRCATWGGAF